DYLAMLRHPGVPPHQLDLKVDAICTLQRNLCIQKGLVHKAHIIMTSVHRHFIEVWFPDNPESHCIPHISFNFSPPGSDWTVTQKQFPLHLAYTTTFNGRQGLTLARSALDLCIDLFAHGQLYTALAHI
ncbi:hypothetical protein OG21DRAFT_1364809, partial [Imleria badia]